MNKKSQMIYLVTMIYVCFSCENKEKNLDSDTDQLIHLKKIEWPKAYASQDTILLDKILGEEFKMIDNSGNWFTKKDELEWIKSNRTSYDSFSYVIKTLEILDNGTALIFGTGHITKDTVKSVYESSNVLVKREGQWKAVLSHVSGYKIVEQ